MRIICRYSVPNSTIPNCDGRLCSLPHRRRRISESLLITTCSCNAAQHGRIRRREENLIVRSGKSEAEVTTNEIMKDGARCIVLMTLEYRQIRNHRAASLRQQIYGTCYYDSLRVGKYHDIFKNMKISKISKVAWYLICYSTLVKLFNFFIIYFFLLCYHYMVNKDVYFWYFRYFWYFPENENFE